MSRSRPPGAPTRSQKLFAALHATSREAGVECLDDAWQGMEHPYRFRCAQAHEWQRKGSVQKNYPHCPTCARGVLRGTELLRAVPDAVCLDPEWKGSRHAYHFRCSEGHEWRRRPDALALNLNCPGCASSEKSRRGLFTAMLEATAAAGLQCVDASWQGRDHKYRFRCPEGHEWQRLPQLQLAQPRCPRCALSNMGLNQRRHENFAKVLEIARTKGGHCLSPGYEGRKAKHRFRCAAGHEWETLVQTVLNGSWCRPCAARETGNSARLPDGIERLRRHAAGRGGECLTAEYQGGLAYYAFRCSAGHEWQMRGAKALRGGWCQRCAFDAKRLTIDHAHEAAKLRGGRCLSETYVNSESKLRWLCHRGHEWLAPLATVRAGHWCKQCASIERITNGNSKARRKYDDSGGRLRGRRTEAFDTNESPGRR